MEKILADKFYAEKMKSLSIIGMSVYLNGNDEITAIEDWLWHYCSSLSDDTRIAKIIFDSIKSQISLEILNNEIKNYDEVPF